MLQKTCARRCTWMRATHPNTKNGPHKGQISPITTRRLSNSKEPYQTRWLHWSNSSKWSGMKTVTMNSYFKRLSLKTYKSWWKDKNKAASTKFSTPKTTSENSTTGPTTLNSTSSGSTPSSKKVYMPFNATSQSSSAHTPPQVKQLLLSMRLHTRSKTEAESSTLPPSRPFPTKSTGNLRKSF